MNEAQLLFAGLNMKLAHLLIGAEAQHSFLLKKSRETFLYFNKTEILQVIFLLPYS